MTLHFVNASKQLGSPPKIKNYTIGSNAKRDEFLKSLEQLAVEESAYYRRLKK